MYKATYQSHQLQFKREARTSRNVLTTHTVYYLKLIRLADGKITYGEAAPLKGLSIDDVPDFEQKMQRVCEGLSEGLSIEALDLQNYPSIYFAVETALLSMQHQQPFLLFETNFTKGIQTIPINGLVWMNEKETMLQEALEKASTGFDTIKFKVGALDFDEECRMLEAFRKQFNAFKVTIRLDANGAFANDEAHKKLKELARFDIHSIEQPIKPKQWEAMQELCATTSIAIALDEELIGVDVHTQGQLLLQYIQPQYIILKPTLIGGLNNSEAWIKWAQKQGIGWWATSALESNIGLNAIAQFTSTQHIQMPQGLGTGSLYTNNIPSPLVVSKGQLLYEVNKPWEIPKDSN
ncbi:MAG: o-succinylbenzoate synthase [Bacteroidota bacterium]|jgi:o-succinylbenzoate synthase